MVCFEWYLHIFIKQTDADSVLNNPYMAATNDELVQKVIDLLDKFSRDELVLLNKELVRRHQDYK